VLQALGELVKSGEIGQLKVVNIQKRPDVAKQLGVRTVPWVRVGPFELDGLRSHAELRQWANRAGSIEGLKDYFVELFTTGALKKVVELVRREPAYLDALPPIVEDLETELHARVGVGAVMEELTGQPLLARLVKPLGRLTRHPNASVRADACHYLSLTRQADAPALIRPLLNDPDSSVREVAEESLAALAPP